MQKITPHLWFDKEAKEAAEFYTSVFPNSKITNITTLHDTPSGSVEIVSFVLSRQAFMAISAGPLFKFNPSISSHVKCKTKDEVDALWKKLSKGGIILMELGKYPWSEKYGWLQDKYGLSWQIIFVGEGEIKQKITPVLMFVGDVCGKAEEAVNFYTSVFKNAPFDSAQAFGSEVFDREAQTESAQARRGVSKVGNIIRYGKGEEPDRQGSLKYAAFTLEGQEFGAMDSAHKHNFTFNEAISFMVYCETQKGVDYFWEKLSAVPEAEQCGWLKDKYGLSWQIVPTALGKMMTDGSKEQIDRVTQAFLPMKKFDIAKLKKAYEGR
ncbi:VOC family protein [Candidatus Curtissbacteria bacterium]|nr:VOC family protein [Candidatus Curtissbacteria bacterium]